MRYDEGLADEMAKRWEAATGLDASADEAGEYLDALLDLAYRCRGSGLTDQEETIMGWAEEHVAAAEKEAR